MNETTAELLMFNELVEITPEMAAEWLQRNTNNRPLMPGKVKYFCNELRTGRAATTHQGMAFDTYGRLQDGQHRLQAIVETGIPWAIWVTQNAPVDNFHLVDVGAKRTLADLLAIRGRKNAKFMASVGRLAWAWERGRPSFSSTNVRDEEINALIERYPGFEDMVHVMDQKELGLTPTQLSFMIWIGDDDEFSEQLLNPDPNTETPGGTLAAQYRRRAMNKAPRDAKRTMALFVKARNDHTSAQQPPAKGYAVRDRDAFPLPNWDPQIPFARTEDDEEDVEGEP